MIKNKINNKVFFLIKIFVIYFIFSIKLYSNNDILNNIVYIGSNEAPVKIKVYSSFTCPHCANFHSKVIPKLKKMYVDSNKVQIIFIDFPLDQAAFNASKLLQCLDKNKQMIFMDKIYETQSKWTASNEINGINANLKIIVKNLGISSDQFDKCLIDDAISDKILSGRIEASKKYSINSTPTVIINEKKLEGSASFKNIKKRIDDLI